MKIELTEKEKEYLIGTIESMRESVFLVEFWRKGRNGGKPLKNDWNPKHYDEREEEILIWKELMKKLEKRGK